MIFSKKNHPIVGQNDKRVRQSQKHEVNVQKNTTLYFQVGLALTLFVVYGLLEMRFEVSTWSSDDIQGPEIEDVFVLNDKNIIIVDDAPKKDPKPKKKIVLVKDPIIKDNDHEIKKALGDLVTTAPQVAISGTTKIGDIDVVTEEEAPVPILGIEQVPIYPGCENLNTNEERRSCMSAKITKLVGRKFNADKLASRGLSGLQRVFVEFTIDKKGAVTAIKTFTRNKAYQDELNNEARRVTEKIPNMQPGKQSGKIVPVRFSLPIVINFQN